MARNVIGPASDKQEKFIQSEATIIVYGGSAGSGKSHCGLMRHLRWKDDPHYRGYVIRKNNNSLMKSGGLFDEAMGLYSQFGGKPNKQAQKFVFPSGAEIAFSHYENDTTTEKYRGLQLSTAMYDEATEAEERHIWWLYSRLRSKAKMEGSIWLTCNPNPDSFLFEWVKWYLYPEGHELEGRPDPDKNGIIRWMCRIGDKLEWGATKEELIEKFGPRTRPLSFQFIGGTIYDNPPLLESNPSYLTALENLPRVEKERMLFGNWLARSENSGFFKRDWCQIIPLPPTNIIKRVRAWDLAGTLPSETMPNPDYTAGVLMSKDKHGKYYIEDVIRFRARHGEVLDRIISTAKHDGADTVVILPREPGQAGMQAASFMVRHLSEEGFYAKAKPTNQSKITRFAPFSATAEAKNVSVVRGEWNEDYFKELEMFDGSRNKKDD